MTWFCVQGAHFETDDRLCSIGDTSAHGIITHTGLRTVHVLSLPSISDKVRVIGQSSEEPSTIHVWESIPPYSIWDEWSTTLCSMPSLTCDNIKLVYNSQRSTYIAAVEAEVAMVRVARLYTARCNNVLCFPLLCLEQVYVIEEGGGFKFFRFPSHFIATDLIHHSATSTFYLVGNEVCY